MEVMVSGGGGGGCCLLLVGVLFQGWCPGEYLACVSVSVGFIKDSVQMVLSEIELEGHAYSSGIQVEG